MLEEHLLITPFGRGEFSVHLKRTDECFRTAERKRLVCGVNIIDSAVSWESLELWHVTHVVSVLKLCWNHILNRSMRMESQFEWENSAGSCITILIVISVVRETNFLNVVGEGSKLISKKI